MDTEVVRPKSRRGRKRKINNVENVMTDTGGEEKAVETRSSKLVDRYVRKEFLGSGVLLGRVIFYNSGFYRVIFEDGHCEDLISSRVNLFLVEDGDLTGDWAARKVTLNELLSGKDVNTKDLMIDDTGELKNANSVGSPSLNEMIDCYSAHDEVVKVHNKGNGDADSSSGSCEGTREGEAILDMEVPLAPPPQLPPSSGNICIPEQYVPHLLSVYSFLRSFSVRLFLYPFGLDDFVGALNCSTANTLLDSVHVALMNVLKRQLEKLLSDGSELASRILGCLDWSLLDTMTWSIYLVHYLMVKNGDDWKEFYTHCLERDYNTLPSGKKLIVLQILCEDVLDTEELRAEMDMRVELEVGEGIDTSIMVGTISEPRRVHPRFCETSACKDLEAVQDAEEHRVTKSFLDDHSLGSHVGEAVGNSIHEDGNGDECRLCGMEGLLVCCDGCPSCYHSRCIGISKTFMPDGSWYCPECEINAREPKVLRGTALRGGDILGVDPYGQVFLASCDHLLLLKALNHSDNGLRYYHRRDIPDVLSALSSNEEHAVKYSEICSGIMEYWGLSPDILPCNKLSDICLQLENKERSGPCNTQFVNLLDKVPEMIEVENHGSCATGSCADMTGSWLTSRVQEPISSKNSLNTATISDQHLNSMGQQCEIMKTTMTEPTLSDSLIGQPADPSELCQQYTSCLSETLSSRNSNVKCNVSVNGGFLEAKTPLLSQELNSRVHREACGSPQNWCLYMGSYFKTTGYLNHYLHGDFAASAAANLAILSCKGDEVWETCSSDNQQKVLGASIALQLKAFSSAGMRFFWPNTERKLVEVPRERCSWCFTCKTAVTSKKGCLLNAAASNAIRGATKLPSCVRPPNDGDGRLSGIATYILYMEESLSGLLIGSFLKFRKQWRKQVGQATTSNAIKILLLEFEENIRPIALSGDWLKLVEGLPTPSSTSQIVATAPGLTQKPRPGRRGRIHSVVAEVADNGCLDILKLNDFTWWRGGRLSKRMLQRGSLPFSIIKKSARQGGKKKIPGVNYVEGGNKIPKNSRQLVWRSAVEISRTLPQLALQVRYLDFHVRWGELVRPEQAPCDGKGPVAEASAFRNAFICGKKIVEYEIRYCVAFGNQKHLPSRVMKNVTETDQVLGDGKERYWFSETYIPLYLINEYEQKVVKTKPVDVLSKLNGRMLKASRECIFSFLFWKQENTVRSCYSCHQHVLYRDAVKCSACQGFCHKQCSTSSTVNLSDGSEYVILCKQCCEIQAATRVKSNHEPRSSPTLLQGQDIRNPAMTSKLGKLLDCEVPSASPGALERSSKVKSINYSKKISKSNWGLIWRKKDCEDTGFDFRQKNILMKGNLDVNMIQPVCRLCSQPYSSDLMYIRCDTCKHWFHADAVELDESKIFSLVGFKCCKCRRTKSPECPYAVKKKALEDKIQRQQLKMDFDSCTISDQHNISKLPIRRSSKGEVNLDCRAATNTFRSGSTNPLASVQQISSSKKKVDDGMEIEFQPETIFSSTKFVKSVDSGYENVKGNCKSPSNVTPGETAAQIVTCRFCSKAEGSLDYCCQICGMWIHRSCSPWIESSSDPEGWRCGTCRDWR